MRERIAYRRLYAAEDLGNGFGPLAARFSPRLDMTEPAASTYVRTYQPPVGRRDPEGAQVCGSPHLGDYAAVRRGLGPSRHQGL